MSFYVRSTPEVADYFGYIYSNKGCIYIVSDDLKDVTVISAREWNHEKCKHLHSLPEFYFHNTLSFLPVVPKEPKTNKQNEKPDQKYENENMDSKEEFPVVGQKVVILNTENYTLTPFGEGFVGKEVTVVSKFTTPETDYALPTKMVSVLIDELDGYSGVCACFRENMCHSIKTEREKEIEGLLDIVYLGGTINEIAERLYNEGYRKLKD